jgi:hypothetical protein
MWFKVGRGSVHGGSGSEEPKMQRAVENVNRVRSLHETNSRRRLREYIRKKRSELLVDESTFHHHKTFAHNA